MAAPSTFSPHGTVPQYGDTRLLLWRRKLATIIGNQTNPDPKNNPSKSDTIRVLRVKCVNAARGT